MSLLQGLLLAAVCLINTAYGLQCFECYHEEWTDGRTRGTAVDNPACQWGSDEEKGLHLGSAFTPVECVDKDGLYPPEWQWECAKSETKIKDKGVDRYSMYRGCVKTDPTVMHDSAHTCSEDYQSYNPYLVDELAKNKDTMEFIWWDGCSCQHDVCNGGSTVLISSLTFVLVAMAIINNW